MSKMFYTLPEAAERLGKSEDEVRKMAETGQIQEFRDRDKLMFKVDQVDLLADDSEEEEQEPDAGVGRGDPAEMSSMIPLAADETGGGSSMLSLEESSAPAAEPEPAPAKGSEEADTGPGEVGEEKEESAAFDLEASSDETASSGSAGSGSGSGLGDSRGKSGVSIFDADELEEADPSAVTQVSDEGGLDDLSLENVGSGSGLMDLTRESDDTSLGTDAFLDELSSDSAGSMAGAAASGEMPTATDLFEGAEQEPETAPAAPAAVAAAPEAYDGKGSGLVGGLAFGAVIALAVGVLSVVTGMMGVVDGGLTTVLADQFLIVVGAMAGVTLLAGVAGFLLGGKS